MRHLNAKYMKSIVAKTITPKLGAALVLSALVCLAGLQAAEAGVNVWTSIGPYGETISTLAIDPQNPATLYAAGRGDPGSVLTGVLKSTDGSGTWSAVNSGLTDLRIYTPAIDPATGDYDPRNPGRGRRTRPHLGTGDHRVSEEPLHSRDAEGVGRGYSSSVFTALGRAK